MQKKKENLDSDGVKSMASLAVKNIAGVYGIINLVNGKMYVGSAVLGRIQVRLYKHLYSLQGSPIIAAAIAKYGLKNFAFVVIAVIPEFDVTINNQDLLDLETHYINALPTSYNIARIAGNTTGVLHTEESKALMRANYSDERRAAVGALNRGKQLSFFAEKNWNSWKNPD